MSDHGISPNDQAQIDSRENLFYFLRTLSKQAGPDGSKSREESHIKNEQLETYPGLNGIVL
jgi:hypothetical protein